MFIKSLKISSPTEIIRDIPFYNGLNLIIDNTPVTNKIQTGNNVGKTTVLKLIDICLGAESKIVYLDTESKRNEYKLIKDFLIENEITISLEVIENFESQKPIFIERNFLSRNKAVRRINSENFSNNADFENKLKEIFFPNQTNLKPTFRQIISHYNRYTDIAIENTLRTIPFAKDTEYESLYLYLLGIEFSNGDQKHKLIEKKAQEEQFKKRIENGRSRTIYETLLKQIDETILQLDEQKSLFGINSDFEADLETLDNIKFKITKISSDISNLTIRKDLINQTIQNLNNDKTDINVSQIRTLYNEVKYNVENIQKTFEDLVEYHNKMIVEKVKFISQELPSIESTIEYKQNELNKLLADEIEYSNKVSKHESFGTFEEIIAELNEKYRQKGEYEAIIAQIKTAETNIKDTDKELKIIESDLFSDAFMENLQDKISKFNHFYSAVSSELYGEQYVLTCEKKEKKGKTVYDFNSFNTNMSSGKKQGEILCFDIAYILYARQENLPHFDFVLNDKKELLHGNQLEKVAEYVSRNGIQMVLPILKDKIPEQVLTLGKVVLELSQTEKLFMVE